MWPLPSSLVPTILAESESVEGMQGSGLLALASLLPGAKYCSLYLSQIVGPHVSWLNPFINGWFIEAYHGAMDGRPSDTELVQVTASASGATIGVTNPFIFDILESADNDEVSNNATNINNGTKNNDGTQSKNNTKDNSNASSERKKASNEWQVHVVYLDDIKSSPSAIAVITLSMLLLYAVPVACMMVRDDYSGVGSIAYVTFGIMARFVEKATHTSKEYDKAARHEKTNSTDTTTQSKQGADNSRSGGLLYRPSMKKSIVLLHAKDKTKLDIEALAHPSHGERFPGCAIIYRVLLGVLWVSWLILMEINRRSETVFTNGYIELATLVLSAIGEALMKHFAVLRKKVETIHTDNAITAVGCLAAERLLNAPGVPKRLLCLDVNETKLIHELYNKKIPDQVDQALWDQVPKCNKATIKNIIEGKKLQIEPPKTSLSMSSGTKFLLMLSNLCGLLPKRNKEAIEEIVEDKPLQKKRKDQLIPKINQQNLSKSLEDYGTMETTARYGKENAVSDPCTTV